MSKIAYFGDFFLFSMTFGCHREKFTEYKGWPLKIFFQWFLPPKIKNPYIHRSEKCIKNKELLFLVAYFLAVKNKGPPKIILPYFRRSKK
jgi:hypothetical protein